MIKLDEIIAGSYGVVGKAQEIKLAQARMLKLYVRNE
jgi:hypothetical protein